MSIEELKTNWEKVEAPKKSQSQFKKMTQLKNHPKLNGLRIKFIVETTALVFFLVVFQDFFDAEKHSNTMNFLLAATAVLYILNDIYGFFIIKNPVQGSNLSASTNVFMKKLKFLSLTSIATSLLFSILIIIYFSSIVTFDTKRWILLAVFTVTLIVMFAIMARNWRCKIKVLEEFNNEVKET